MRSWVTKGRARHALPLQPARLELEHNYDTSLLAGYKPKAWNRRVRARHALPGLSVWVSLHGWLLFDRLVRALDAFNAFQPALRRELNQVGAVVVQVTPFVGVRFLRQLHQLMDDVGCR